MQKARLTVLLLLSMCILLIGGTVNAAPGAFELVSPPDATALTTVPASLDITWSPSETATSYTFELDRPTGENVLLSGLTPAGDDADNFVCDLVVCTLSIADTSPVLNANGSYSWTVTASDGTETTPASNNPYTFTINTADIAPGVFDLISPTNGAELSEVPASLAITWSEAAAADTYTFDLDRPTSANVTLSGLTPVEDSDDLTCLTGTCTLNILDTTGVIVEDGLYSWTVTATNASGDTFATNSPFTFTVTTAGPESFDLLTPPDNSVLTDVPATLDITWSEASGAETYTFTLDRPTGTDVELAALTPASDADTLTCDAGTCTLNVADTTPILDENGVYMWTVEAVNPEGTTGASNNPFSFTVADADFVPSGFELLTPPDGSVITEMPVSLSITWTEAGGAATYTFDLDRPTAENVTLAGLTAAADADTLACGDGSCTLFVMDAASVLTEQGAYSWTVVASNPTGDTPATNNPFTFTVDIPLIPAVFNLLAPADGALVRDPAQLTTITWEEAVNATSYNFILFQISNNTRIGEAANIVVDSSICVTGICTLVVPADLQMALEDGTYSWTVVATGPDGTTEAANAPAFFTVNTGPLDLVVNGGFEAKTVEGGKDLTPWDVRNLTGDKIKCNNPGLPHFM